MRFRIALSLQRAAHKLRKRNRLLSAPVAFLYRLYALGLLGVDIPVSTKLGTGIRIFHGFALVIHPNAVIGNHVTLRHSTTIGSRDEGPDGKAPRIEDGVNIGCNCLVLGDITIGAGSTLGAGSIVTKSITPGSVTRGETAKVFKKYS